MKNLFLVLFASLLAFSGFSQAPVTVATSVTLNGSGSDVDGTIVSYKWVQISGPAIVSITSPTSAVTTVTGYKVPGLYKYELTVTDNQGATGKATTDVTVLASNAPPRANAGGNIIIQLPPGTTSMLTPSGRVSSSFYESMATLGKKVK